jgi:hypothetical protein
VYGPSEGAAAMNTISMSWDAFVLAMDEVTELTRSGGNAIVVADLLQHAREVLDILDVELGLQGIELSSEGRSTLSQLRGRLESLEKDVMPARH